MRISGLKIENVGVFDDLEIIFEEQKNEELAEIHIFTGENGTGKSTILYALVGSFLVDGDETHKTSILSNNIQIENRLRDTLLNECIEVLYDNNKAFTRLGLYAVHNFPLENYRRRARKFPTRNSITRFNLEFAAFAYSGSRNLSSVAVDSIKEFSFNPFENSLSFDKTISSEVITTWIANTKAKQSLMIVEGNEEKAKIIGETIKRIEEAASDIIGSEIQFIMKSDPFEVKVKYNNVELEFSVLPDGLKSILSWISDLLIRLDRIPWESEGDILDRKFILFLDEIEIHLHPAWQRKVLPVIQKLFKNAQIFVSSHSPFVVNSVSGAWVHKLKLNEKGVSELVESLPSKAGSSYSLVLDEVFGMDEWFDVETEKELSWFYDLKDKYIKAGQTAPAGTISDIKNQLLTIAGNLSEKSGELQNLVGAELRQLSRITGKDLSL